MEHEQPFSEHNKKYIMREATIAYGGDDILPSMNSLSTSTDSLPSTFPQVSDQPPALDRARS